MAEKRPAEPAAAAAAEGATGAGAAGDAEDELRAAKRRALEEAKRAALARILEGTQAAGAAAPEAPLQAEGAAPEAGAAIAEGDEDEEGDSSSEGDDDDDDDPSRPVATLDIVKFLRQEQEAAVGQVLDTNASNRPGLIVQKEAVMQRRVPKGLEVPKPEDMVGGGAVVAAPAGPPKASLPKGARPAHKAAGSFLWAGAGEGGVSFDPNRQRQRPAWRPPPASLPPPVKAGLVGAAPPSGGVFTNATLRAHIAGGAGGPAAQPSPLGADVGHLGAAPPMGGVFTNATLRAHIAGGAGGPAAQPAAQPGLVPLRARFQAAPKKAGW